jgi:hypothetical protein
MDYETRSRVGMALELQRISDELAAAKAELAACQKKADAVARAFNALHEQLAACREDAERYRWLAGNKIDYATHGDGMAWATMNWCVEINSMAPQSLNGAIDEARKEGA